MVRVVGVLGRGSRRNREQVVEQTAWLTDPTSTLAYPVLHRTGPLVAGASPFRIGDPSRVALAIRLGETFPPITQRGVKEDTDEGLGEVAVAYHAAEASTGCLSSWGVLSGSYRS